MRQVEEETELCEGGEKAAGVQSEVVLIMSCPPSRGHRKQLKNILQLRRVSRAVDTFKIHCTEMRYNTKAH